MVRSLEGNYYFYFYINSDFQITIHKQEMPLDSFKCEIELEIKNIKDRSTIVNCVNMDGSHKLPIMASVFEEYELNSLVIYKNNRKAWMTKKEMFKDLILENNLIILSPDDIFQMFLKNVLKNSYMFIIIIVIVVFLFIIYKI